MIFRDFWPIFWVFVICDQFSFFFYVSLSNFSLLRQFLLNFNVNFVIFDQFFQFLCISVQFSDNFLWFFKIFKILSTFTQFLTLFRDFWSIFHDFLRYMFCQLLYNFQHVFVISDQFWSLFTYFIKFLPNFRLFL